MADVCICALRNYNAAMSYYSRKGDDGTTGWLGKGRLPKDHVRMEAVGTIDEASAAVGLARSAARAAADGGAAARRAAGPVSPDGRGVRCSRERGAVPL